MSSNISSFHKHDIKIRNVSHFDLRWYYQLIHLWNGTPPCIFIVIWSQIKSFYSSCYTIQSICILSSYQNNAVNVFFNFWWDFWCYYYNFLFSDPHVAPLRILLQIYELEKLKYLFLNLCQMIFPQNTMILNNLQDMRIRLIKTILINKDYN